MALVLSHIPSPRVHGMLCCVNKAFKKVMEYGPYWTALSRAVCGEKYFVPIPRFTPHADDERYIAKLRMCPWLSEPRVVRFVGSRRFSPLVYRGIENVSVDTETISFLVKLEPGGVSKALVYSKIFDGIETTCDAKKHQLQDEVPRASDEAVTAVLEKLGKNRMLPDQFLDPRLFHLKPIFDDDLLCILKDRQEEAFSIIHLHGGAFAIFGETTDFYIFSSDCKRLLARLYKEEKGNTRLICSGPCLYVVDNNRFTFFVPDEGKVTGNKMKDGLLESGTRTDPSIKPAGVVNGRHAR